MGTALQRIYDYVGEKGALPAKMRLAMKTGLPEQRAAASPDSPDLVAKFRAAAKEITGAEPPV
jgi:hypothetical protein